jgi:single-strand DNA-binding protein
MANIITVIGRIGRDPEYNFTPKGVPAIKFSVADDRQKDANGGAVTQWFNCSAYDQLAELLNKYFTKGKPIIVTGKLDVRSYNKKDGTPAYSLDLRVSGFDFVPFSEKKDGEEHNKFADPQEQEPPPEYAGRPVSAGPDYVDPGPDSEIPDPFADQG